jgi:hypothetical protein
MLGATSNSRPWGSWNGSNWPSTLPARNPSSPPTSAPVTFAPTLRPIPLGGLLAAIFSIIGRVATAKPSALACTQPGRSTTRIGAVTSGASSPVNSRTSPVERCAPARSSATASSASARLTTGPSPASLDPSATARPQSIIGGSGAAGAVMLGSLDE